MSSRRHILVADALWDTVLGVLLLAGAAWPGSVGLDFTGGPSRALLGAVAAGCLLFAFVFALAARGWRTGPVGLAGAGINALAVVAAVAVAVGARGVTAGGTALLLIAAGICAAFAATEVVAFSQGRQRNNRRRRDVGPTA